MCEWGKTETKAGRSGKKSDKQCRGQGVKWVKGVERYKLAVMGKISRRDEMYSMVTIVNDTVSYFGSCNRVDLKNSQHKKKTFLVTMCAD